MELAHAQDTTYLTVSEAAARLRLHPATIRRYADNGVLPHSRTPGSHRRFLLEDVDKLLTPAGEAHSESA